MAEVAWSEELCVGIAKVDDEHQQLVATLNQLNKAMKTGKGSKVMRDIIAQMVQYTQFHFESEEKLMLECDYPRISLHQAQHRQLEEKLLKFQIKFEKSGQRITKEMMVFLTNWLTRHILVDDKAFAKFYSETTVGS